jgi:UV DNA damage endonuclease
LKIGYPCINRTIGCRAARTFRLRSYSERRLVETVGSNLDCLLRILRFNLEHGILFFRITSDLVPFASHPVCEFNWQDYFGEEFRRIGSLIRRHGIRISMHPDQFTLINSPKEEVFQNSHSELAYHAELLDLLELDSSAKIQLHGGGVYGDKARSMERFIERFALLDPMIKCRLVLENDDRSYNLADCIRLSRETGIPVLFDYLHHRVNSSAESLREALQAVSQTWRGRDGLPMVDYSSQQPGMRSGKHAESLCERDFKAFLGESQPLDFDLMLEIKDKERSALRAIEIASGDRRFLRSSGPS